MEKKKMTIFETIDAKFAGPMASFSTQKHLKAVRDGIVSTIPYVIVGSVFMLLASFPLPEGNVVFDLQTQYKADILVLYYATMGIIALYASFSIGYYLSESYDLPKISGGLISICGYVIALAPTFFNPSLTIVKNGFKATDEGWAALAKQGNSIPLSDFAAKGLFTAIVVGLVSVEIMRFCMVRHLTIKLPDAVPPSVARSFEAIVPVAFVSLLFGAIAVGFKLNLLTVVGQLVGHLISFGGHIGGAILIVFLNSFFWWFGIHGSAVTDPITAPMWLTMIGENADANALGEPMTHLFVQPFFQNFVYIGGSGCTLGLAIAFLIVAKSKYGKSISRTTVFPAIFNINEPIIFGYPVMLNPILLIPFICVPIILLVFSWIVTSLGWVAFAFAQPPWTIPAPLGAFLATGDWRASVLSVVCLAISVVIYLPFIKAYDASLKKDEDKRLLEEQAAEVK
jgi:PTS system cellobiose-specific IIC component